MALMQYLPYLILGLLLLSLFALPILGGGILLHWGKGIKREPLPWLFWLVAIVIIAGPLQSQRNLSGIGAMFEADFDRFVTTLWFNRLVSVAVLLLAMERLIRFVVNKEVLPPVGKGLLVALLFYSLTNHFSNAFWGTRPDFSHQAVYPVLAAIAATLVAQDSGERCLKMARDAFLMVLISSAVALVIKPELVLQRGYVGGLFPIRYWGLGPHANVLSPMAVAFIIIAFVLPYRKGWINVCAMSLALMSLVATQSKTALAALFVIGGILGYYRFIAPLGQGAMFRRPALVITALALLVVLSVGLLIGQLAFDAFDRIERFLGSDAGAGIASLSNRDLIWPHAIREFNENPVFGYGPSLFDGRYRMQIGIGQAFHAHNQALHSLGAAGALGLAGLLMYFGVLTWAAIQAASASRGLSLALYVLVAVRAITEIPLTLRTASSAEFLIHLALFIACIAYARRPNRSPASREQPSPFAAMHQRA